ncbi:TetR/AcrR family transcriptional regulator [Phenylobacterium sp.]|uniref:TetR/AcrR family transcriptional regulator n=1 Tax=Phenylobacterium sp. TaxID=1871053 RepID=UPI00272F806B|nr:TetR/AcrR family transcriptional regulator [Phenylobacterium sp.]MDP2212722.1 TetR/AcrR family transcriptional regulator [Phenylobacterium sp.]
MNALLAFGRTASPLREDRQLSDAKRKIPRQRRAADTVEIILEAAAQLLERDGLEGFTTNAVAERAGVSIGALYRYFPNKRVLTHALAERESDLHGAEMQRLLRETGGGLAPDRALVRAFIGAFQGRARARRIAMGVWFEMTPSEVVATRLDAFTRDLNQAHDALEPITAFVLTRAMHGALRAAVLEGVDFFNDPAFEDELVSLSRAYLAQVRARAAAQDTT